MNSITVMIIEDEPALRTMLRYTLEPHNFNVIEAEDGQEALTLIKKQCPDIILMDWMLPHITGVTLTKQLKSRDDTQHIPIILLTAKAEEENKLIGFASGADDYVVKPFSPKELMARMPAVLRRHTPKKSSLVHIDALTIDLHAHRVSVQDNPIKLSPIEYKLLTFLASNPDRVFSRDHLLSQVWGRHAYLDERTVDVQMRRLRNKLKPYNHHHIIHTVRGSGYRLSPNKDTKK